MLRSPRGLDEPPRATQPTLASVENLVPTHRAPARALPRDAALSPSHRRWAEFFDHPTEATLRRLEEEDTIMADAIHKLRSASADDAAHYLAEARFKGEVKHRLDIGYEREEARSEERIRTLARQIEFEFGPLSPTTRARVDAASPEELDILRERILFAQDVDDVFAPMR